MRVLWGILAILMVTASVIEAKATCVSHDSDSHGPTIQISYHSDESTPLTSSSHDCPTGCHTGGGHCHAHCFKHVATTSIRLEVRPIGHRLINGIFTAPSAPHLEGNRRPPKLA